MVLGMVVSQNLRYEFGDLEILSMHGSLHGGFPKKIRDEFGDLGI